MPEIIQLFCMYCFMVFLNAFFSPHVSRYLVIENHNIVIPDIAISIKVIAAAQAIGAGSDVIQIGEHQHNVVVTDGQTTI